MKRIAHILTALSLAVLFSGASAHAQNDGQRVIANIPFEFTSGNLTFPLGQYEFVRSGAFYLIRDAGGRGQYILAGVPIQPTGVPEKSNLKFATVNGRQFLVQIWIYGASNGNEFQQANASRESDKNQTIENTVPGGRQPI